MDKNNEQEEPPSNHTNSVSFLCDEGRKHSSLHMDITLPDVNQEGTTKCSVVFQNEKTLNRRSKRAKTTPEFSQKDVLTLQDVEDILLKTTPSLQCAEAIDACDEKGSTIRMDNSKDQRINKGCEPNASEGENRSFVRKYDKISNAFCIDIDLNGSYSHTDEDNADPVISVNIDLCVVDKTSSSQIISTDQSEAVIVRLPCTQYSASSQRSTTADDISDGSGKYSRTTMRNDDSKDIDKPGRESQAVAAAPPQAYQSTESIDARAVNDSSSLSTKVLKWKQNSETHVHIPALKYGCHKCMQLMKQKYMRHFVPEKKKKLQLAGCPSPTLPNRPSTTLTWYVPLAEDGGGATGALPSGRNLYGGKVQDNGQPFSLPSLGKEGSPSQNEQDENRHTKNKLRWIDALNAWVPVNKTSNKGNPYLSFINAAPRVEKTFARREESDLEEIKTAPQVKSYQEKLHRIKIKLAEKELAKRVIMSLQRATKLTVDKSLALRRPRKSYSSPLHDAENRRQRTVRFQSSQSAHQISEEIKVPEAKFDPGGEQEDKEEDEEEMQEEEPMEEQLLEAPEQFFTTVLEFGNYDIIEPLDTEFESISATEIPTSIIPKYNAALTKLRDQNTLPEPEIVTATDTEAHKEAKRQKKEIEDALKPKNPTPPPREPTPQLPSPKPETSPPPKPQTPDPPKPEEPLVPEPQTVQQHGGSMLTLLPRFTKSKVSKSAKPPAQPTTKPKPVRAPKQQPPVEKPQPSPVKAPLKVPQIKPTPQPQVKVAPPPPKLKPAPLPSPLPKSPVQKPSKPKEVKAPRPQPPKPIPAKKQKPVVIRTASPEEDVKYAEFLPISRPEDMFSEEGDNKTEEAQQEIKRSRSPIKKKERMERKALTPEPVSSAPSTLLPPLTLHQKRGSIVWSDTDNEKDVDDGAVSDSDTSSISISALPPDLPEVELEQYKSRKKRERHALQPDLSSSRRGVKKIDPAWEEEQRRLRLAEERRRKQQEIYNKLRSKGRQITKMESETSSMESRASFEDYDFLAKYCIFPNGSLDMYKQAFMAVDDQERGWLDEQETAIALRGVNNKLSGTEEKFLFRIVEMTGYRISDGADFKLFSVLAALSHRISALDSWMKLMISEMNFKVLEMKTFLCKNLWEICVDTDSKRIPIDQLIVELRSGGISKRDEEDVKEKLGHLHSMDLLDFLTYSPLFIMIHQSVVDNPLTQSWE